MVHCVAPGVQEPAQAPPEQTKGQAEVTAHCPEASQVSTLVPLHWFEPGEHTPSQAPLLQAKGQVEEVPQVIPSGEQVSTSSPLHCVAPGVQRVPPPAPPVVEEEDEESLEELPPLPASPPVPLLVLEFVVSVDPEVSPLAHAVAAIKVNIRASVLVNIRRTSFQRILRKPTRKNEPSHGHMRS